MNKYRLTLTFPFESFDDIEARIKTKELCDNLGIDIKGVGDDLKLQKVFKNSPPQKVTIS